MEPMDLTRNAPVALAGVAIKQDAAGLARASDSTLLHFQRVSVHGAIGSGHSSQTSPISRGMRTNRCKVASGVPPGSPVAVGFASLLFMHSADRACPPQRALAYLPYSHSRPGECPSATRTRIPFCLGQLMFACASFRQLFPPDTVTDDISKGRRTRALREGLRALLGSAEPPLRQT